MDRSKDKIFGAKIDNFPPKFLDMIAKYSLAKDNLWHTYAPNEDVAKNQIISFIRDISGEDLADEIEIVSIVKLSPRKKSINIYEKKELK
jgi:hypothetical protein